MCIQYAQYTLYIYLSHVLRNYHWPSQKRCPWFLAAPHVGCTLYAGHLKLQFTPCLAPSIYLLHSFNTWTFSSWLYSRSFWWVVIPQMSLKEIKLLFRIKISMFFVFINVSYRIHMNLTKLLVSTYFYLYLDILVWVNAHWKGLY